MNFLKKNYLFAAALAALLFISCERNSAAGEKDDNDSTEAPATQQKASTDSAHVMDSVDRENKQTLSKADSAKAADSAARHSNPIRDFN